MHASPIKALWVETREQPTKVTTLFWKETCMMSTMEVVDRHHCRDQALNVHPVSYRTATGKAHGH